MDKLKASLTRFLITTTWPGHHRPRRCKQKKPNPYTPKTISNSPLTLNTYNIFFPINTLPAPHIPSSHSHLSLNPPHFLSPKNPHTQWLPFPPRLLLEPSLPPLSFHRKPPPLHPPRNNCSSANQTPFSPKTYASPPPPVLLLQDHSFARARATTAQMLQHPVSIYLIYFSLMTGCKRRN
ncbi:hypothetical protein RHMOL_Rhmol08G0091500 [Rhododendron molle]|uniref:Uncharacterized protein n=1 Tax=Rhododendron molle TaxID=49168 RepID=A0ACC0MM37_RHOML|nr:hypothetical protein RHMOL_Rhmol08G0091500 [Rhododendron molle]